MICVFNILELLLEDDPVFIERMSSEENEQNESWWEENKGAAYAYSLGSIAIIFGLIPWLIGLIMLTKWIFF